MVPSSDKPIAAKARAALVLLGGLSLLLAFLMAAWAQQPADYFDRRASITTGQEGL